MSLLRRKRKRMTLIYQEAYIRWTGFFIRDAVSGYFNLWCCLFFKILLVCIKKFGTKTLLLLLLLCLYIWKTYILINHSPSLPPFPTQEKEDLLVIMYDTMIKKFNHVWYWSYWWTRGFLLLETKLRPTISSQNIVIDGMYL